MIANPMKQHCGLPWEPDDFKDLVYGDFFDKQERPYVWCKQEDKLLAAFNDGLDDYNVTYPSVMNLVFFKDARLHLARTARVIRQPRGNALLVGVSGVGLVMAIAR